MRILISGASGLIGSALTHTAVSAGHTIIPLTRKPGIPSTVHWDPDGGTLDTAGLEGVDAVVHLAGESIAARRWTAAQKARILDSRVKGTQLLSSALAKLTRRPSVMVSASAIGVYGDAGDVRLTESSPTGSDFLAG